MYCCPDDLVVCSMTWVGVAFFLLLAASSVRLRWLFADGWLGGLLCSWWFVGLCYCWLGLCYCDCSVSDWIVVALLLNSVGYGFVYFRWLLFVVLFV